MTTSPRILLYFGPLKISDASTNDREHEDSALYNYYDVIGITAVSFILPYKVFLL